MSSDVFILSAVVAADPANAMRLAVESAGVNSSRVQDAVFGSDGLSPVPGVVEIVHNAGLACTGVVVRPELRALFFAAQSVLSGDVELVVVAGMDGPPSAALVMASPEAVGRLNLLPRARLGARSLVGAELALHTGDITAGDVAVFKSGATGIGLFKELIEELEARQARWGMVSADELALLVERV